MLSVECVQGLYRMDFYQLTPEICLEFEHCSVQVRTPRSQREYPIENIYLSTYAGAQ